MPGVPARPGTHHPHSLKKSKRTMHEMLASLIQWYLSALDQGGYWLIGLLMAASAVVSSR